MRSFPNPPPPSLPRRRESIPGELHSHSLRGSPSRRPCKSGGGSGVAPDSVTSVVPAKSLPPSSRGRESIPGGVHSHSLRGSPSRRPANQVVDLGSPRIPHLRRSGEEPAPEQIGGGNPSPAGCTAIASEAVRHAARWCKSGGGSGVAPDSPPPCRSREGGNPYAPAGCPVQP